MIVIDVLKGKKTNLRSGEHLNVAGMSSSQLNHFLTGLIRQGFKGKVKTD